MTGLPEAQYVEKSSRRGRGWIIALGVLVGLVALLGIAFVLSDGLVRDLAQDVVKGEVQARLPDNVEADVDVEIKGDWVVLQYLSGTMEEVTITAEQAKIDGIPADISVTAFEVSTDMEKPIPRVTAVATIDEEAVNALFTLPGNDPHLGLGEGVFTYADSQKIFGITIGYDVSAKAKALGKTVAFTPVDAQLTSEFGGFDLSELLDEVIGGEPIEVCVADSLPKGVLADDIDVTKGSVTLTLHAENLPLSVSALKTKGSCDAG